MVVVFIVAALVYGGVFFSRDARNTDLHELETDITDINSPADAIKILDKAKEDIGEINKTIDSRRQTADEIFEDDNEFDKYIITVSNIKAGDNIVSPVVIEGEAVAFENTVTVELRNQEHETMVKEYVTTKAPDVGKSGPFKITLEFDFSSTKEGYVAVYEESAKDGSEVNLVEIPITYNKDKLIE